ncbi:MAG: hypothetical protein ACOX6Y_12810 [Christensenellales bacterium]
MEVTPCLEALPLPQGEPCDEGARQQQRQACHATGLFGSCPGAPTGCAVLAGQPC